MKKNQKVKFAKLFLKLIIKFNFLLYYLGHIQAEAFQKVLGVFLSTCATKKLFKDNEGVDTIDEFNSLLYSYSHQKFYSYINHLEVKLIITKVFSKTPVDVFVQKHRALSIIN